MSSSWVVWSKMKSNQRKEDFSEEVFYAVIVLRVLLPFILPCQNDEFNSALDLFKCWNFFLNFRKHVKKKKRAWKFLAQRVVNARFATTHIVRERIIIYYVVCGWSCIFREIFIWIAIYTHTQQQHAFILLLFPSPWSQ